MITEQGGVQPQRHPATRAMEISTLRLATDEETDTQESQRIVGPKVPREPRRECLRPDLSDDTDWSIPNWKFVFHISAGHSLGRRLPVHADLRSRSWTGSLGSDRQETAGSVEEAVQRDGIQAPQCKHEALFFDSNLFDFYCRLTFLIKNVFFSFLFSCCARCTTQCWSVTWAHDPTSNVR